MTEFDLTPPISAQRDAIIAGLTAEEHDRREIYGADNQLS